MKIAQRVQNLNAGGSDGWELFTTARQMRADGVDVINLTVGEADTGTPAAILDAMHKAALSGATGYAPIAGLPELRDAIAARTQDRTGMRTTRDNVLVTPGGQAALYAAIAGTTDPGQHVLYIEPHFTSYPSTIRSLGAVPIGIGTDPENGFQPTATDITARIDGVRSRTLLINSPNNPTGAVYSTDTFDQIAQIARDHDLWLISDEVYETQVWRGQHISPRALTGMAPRTLVVNSLSKSHAMTGSRLGWVTGPSEMIAHLSELSNNTTFGVATFVQHAALWALQQGPSLEAEIAAPFGRRNALARHILEGHPSLRVLPSDGAMYVMLDIRETGLSGLDFARDLLRREAIAVMPGESFGPAAAGHIRLALTVEDRRLENALDRLCGFALRLAA